MFKAPGKLPPDPEVKRLSVKNWLSGVVTAFDDGRTPLEGLKSASNLLLQQDGTLRPRPSMLRYGPQPTGKILGEIYEYKKVSGLATESWMICMQSFGVSASTSASVSPSASASVSVSASTSPSSSRSPSASRSPSSSTSPSSSASGSVSPSASISPSSSSSRSPSASTSPSSSQSLSPSSSRSPSSSVSASTSPSSSASSSTSPSSSRSPSSSLSPSSSSSSSRSPSSSQSRSPSSSLSPSNSLSPSASLSTNSAYGQIYIARGEDLAWTAVTGKFYSSTAKAHFFQLGGKVVIMNGSDNLSYLNIATATVVPFTTVATPTAPTLSADNTAGSGFPITYRVSANSTVGESAASNALTVDTAKDRDLWTGTDNVVINIVAPAGAQSLNIYMGTVSGFEYLIATGLDPTTTTFKDDGTLIQDTTRLYPTTDSTAGPRTSRGDVIAGRAWMTGDADNVYNVWFGGDPGFEMDFSPANGGGNQLVGSGTKDIPNRVKAFRDGRGNPQITVLCSGTNGRGKRFNLTADSITLGSTVLTFYDVIEDNGQDGTDSPDAVVTYNDSLYYPSRDGFKSTGTKPQLQNVLSTPRISNTIQPDIKLLSNSAMDGAVGLGFEGRLYFAVPVSDSSNNEIWVLDLDRKGAWMKPLTIAADWMWLYGDNDGTTHFMVLSDNHMFELSYSSLTQDDGDAFSTQGASGQVYFSDDKRMWVQLLQVIFVILRPQGTISFQVSGKTEDSSLQALGEPYTFTSSEQSSVAGWGETDNNRVGWARYSWSEVGRAAESETDATQEAIVEIDEEVQWASYDWSSVGVGTDYNLSDVIFEYIETGIKDLS